MNMVHGSLTDTPGNSNEPALALDVTEPMDAAATEAQQSVGTRAESETCHVGSPSARC